MILLVAGNTSGRKLRERGQMGVSTSAESDGWTIGPPAESEYAVDPVGVATISPSETLSVKCCPSTYASIVFRCGLLPRWSATSFMTCQVSSESALDPPTPMGLPSLPLKEHARRMRKSTVARFRKALSSAGAKSSISA